MQQHRYRALIALLAVMRTTGRAVTSEQLQRARDERSLRPIAHAYNPSFDAATLMQRARRRRRAQQTHPRKRRRP